MKPFDLLFSYSNCPLCNAKITIKLDLTLVNVDTYDLTYVVSELHDDLIICEDIYGIKYASQTLEKFMIDSSYYSPLTITPNSLRVNNLNLKDLCYSFQVILNCSVNTHFVISSQVITEIDPLIFNISKEYVRTDKYHINVFHNENITYVSYNQDEKLIKHKLNVAIPFKNFNFKNDDEVINKIKKYIILI